MHFNLKINEKIKKHKTSNSKVAINKCYNSKDHFTGREKKR